MLGTNTILDLIVYNSGIISEIFFFSLNVFTFEKVFW